MFTVVDWVSSKFFYFSSVGDSKALNRFLVNLNKHLYGEEKEL